MTPYTVNRQRWSTLSIFDQMGNIYSEVSRSFKAKQNENKDECLHAVDRAIDLFDATIESLVERQSPRAKEVLRAKEEFLNAINGAATVDAVTSLERYFMHFAVAARLRQTRV